MIKKNRLRVLLTRVEKEQSSTELAKGATQLVWDEKGNHDADIIFVGEAPGKKEDETGLPFQGASGRILNELLESIGLARNEVYITNIVKYRPGKNRDPSRAEKQAFGLYLREEIAIIEPKLIVFLGRHSMNEFLPGLAISRVHGQIFIRELQAANGKTQKFKMLPLYHPAAALYNGSLRSTLFEDFKVITDFTESS